jgi:ABC transporter DrrB family efflux protein
MIAAGVGARAAGRHGVAVAAAWWRVVRDSGLIAGRHLRVLRMNPGRLLYPIAQPLLLLVLFVSVFGGLGLAGRPAGGQYRQFLIPGVIVQSAALTAPTTGLALLRDAASGLADRFRALPMSRAAVLIGRLAADAVVFAIQVALLLAAATLLGFRVRAGLAGLAAIVAVSVTFGLAMAMASTWLALVVADPETAERVLFLPAIMIAFVSSAFAPVSALAGWMRPIAAASPVTAAAGLIRSMAGGTAVGGSLSLLAGWVAGLLLLPGVLAVRRWQSSP